MILLSVCAIIGVGPTLAEGNNTAEFNEMIAANEPQPYGGLSLQEAVPFEPISMDPAAFVKQLSSQKSNDEMNGYFQDIGLPLDPNDCAFIFQNKDHTNYALWNASNSASPFAVATVAYAFPRNGNENDSMVFIFVENGDSYCLTDVLAAFGNMQIVSDAQHEIVWLVGETGGVYNTVRWYNLLEQKTALAFVAEGLMTDRTDYHIKVMAVADPAVNGTLPKNGMLAIRKQVSVFDLTQATISTDAREILLYSQVDVYAYQHGGEFKLIKSKRFEGEDMQMIAGMTCDQIISENEE